MGKIKTYNPKQVTISLGTHTVSGLAEDSFVTIDANGEGVTKKVGCDGEIVRSISPDDTYIIKLSLLQTSDTNSFLQERFAQDISTGDALFAVLIKDLKGGLQFSADAAWVVKPSSRGFGRESNNREWEIHTGSGTLNETTSTAMTATTGGITV